jgi:hypothetical protein
MATAVTDMAVPNIDAGPPECNAVADSGCQSGDKCTIGTDDGAPREICFPIATNPVPEGGDCVSVTMGKRVGDNCAAGLSCVVYPGDGPKCRHACFFRSDCATGSGCVVPTISNTFTTNDGGNSAFLRACHADDGCDPVAQDKCSGGKACYLSSADNAGRIGVCLMSLSAKMNGAACTAIADCAPGFRCDSFMFCRRLCYYETVTNGIPTTGQCPAGEGSCELFALSGNDTYGICGAL